MTEEKARAVLGTWKPYEYVSTMPELIAAIASYGREVAAAEREECAKIVRERCSRSQIGYCIGTGEDPCEFCRAADAIRERKA